MAVLTIVSLATFASHSLASSMPNIFTERQCAGVSIANKRSVPPQQVCTKYPTLPSPRAVSPTKTASTFTPQLLELEPAPGASSLTTTSTPVESRHCMIALVPQVACKRILTRLIVAAGSYLPRFCRTLTAMAMVHTQLPPVQHVICPLVQGFPGSLLT